jgi:hypothetical protein
MSNQQITVPSDPLPVTGTADTPPGSLRLPKKGTVAERRAHDGFVGGNAEAAMTDTCNTPPEEIRKSAPKDLLKATLKRPMDKAAMANDKATLGALLGLLNNPAVTGAQVPPEEREQLKSVRAESAAFEDSSDALLASVTSPPEESVPAAPAATREPGVSPSRIGAKLFFTGRVASGKDYCATQVGAHVMGFADPLYALVNACFGLQVSATAGKEIPGVREVLQIFGQWGRGAISGKYPVTPARALFCHHVRRELGPMLPEELNVNWAVFGTDPDIWLDSAIRRADAWSAANPGQRIALTNVRFENEYKRLVAAGWTGYHVMCGANTWSARLKSQGLDTASPALKDTSEELAIHLDKDTIRKVHSPNPGGGMLRVIWNDTAPPPSKRLYTVGQWLQEVAISEVPDSFQSIAQE